MATTVSGMTPSRAGKGKRVMGIVYGTGMTGAENIKLAKSGFADVPMTDKTVVGTTEVHGLFDFGGGSYAGRRDLVVDAITVPDAFWLMAFQHRRGMSHGHQGELTGRPNPGAGLAKAAGLIK